jgi:hypothetical protein
MRVTVHELQELTVIYYSLFCASGCCCICNCQQVNGTDYVDSYDDNDDDDDDVDTGDFPPLYS